MFKWRITTDHYRMTTDSKCGQTTPLWLRTTMTIKRAASFVPGY